MECVGFLFSSKQTEFFQWLSSLLPPNTKKAIDSAILKPGGKFSSLGLCPKMTVFKNISKNDLAIS